MNDETMTTTLTIDAPASAVFDVLADPTQHPAIDGTGWLDKAVDPVPLTAAGQVFRMDMYHENHPDKHYRMSNKVEVLDPPRAIGWMPGQPGPDGELQFGGWTWHYDLVPTGPTTTDVTLTYDWSHVPPQVREFIQFPPFPPAHLSNSLQHLAQLATA